MEKIRQSIHINRFAGALLTLLLSAACAFASHAATYNYPYPTAQNKKGLALGADMEEDGLELNICHATLNLPISWVIAHRWERNSYRSYSYRYKGKTYWFRRTSVKVWDKILKKLQTRNVIVTGILLMEKRSDLKDLIYPKARNKKAAYYAWNMDGGKNQRQIEAAVSFLAERYSSGRHGRIVGWIVGNEIDSASEWNAAGKIGFSSYMDLYARMFEMCSKIIRRVYSNARLYVPLDHFWNIIYSNDFKAKKCLDTFGARMKKDGYPWNLAYHAYNGDLMQPSITAKQYFDTTDKPTSPIITMKNLSVLTKYVREKYGEKTRIILSEHGYSSTWKKKNVSRQQSEAIALSYYLAMADPMVDSFVYYSQVDQTMLTKVGASFGLWKVSKHENATNKKPSWTTFKYMDTDRSDPVLNKARKTSEKMTGTKVAATCSFMKGKMTSIRKYGLKKRLAGGWKKTGAVRSIYRRGAGYTLKRNYSRNKNVYWGLNRSFKKLNVSKYPRLCLTIRNGRLTTKKTELLVRVFSGRKHLFEASSAVRSGKTQRFKIDLKKWKYRNKITKIQILVKRKSGNWKSRAGIVIENIGFG